MEVERPELSVVVLCYRAEDELARFVSPLEAALDESGVDYELILVANYWEGSDDRTPAIAAALTADHLRVRVLAQPKHGAMGFDFRSGTNAARGDYVVVIDGDGQVPVEHALAAHRELQRSGAAVVKGRRGKREDGIVRVLVSIAYNTLFRLVFPSSRGLWDINGRPKGFTRQTIDDLDLRSDDWFTDAEIVLKARAGHLRVHEFSVAFRENPSRCSFVGPGTLWEFLVNMTKWRLGVHEAQRFARVTPEAAGRRG